MPAKNKLSLAEKQAKQELNKSRVRVNVTYTATVFIFGGAIVLMFLAAADSDHFAQALNVYNLILPIGAGIVTYWFATRSNRPSERDDRSENAKQSTPSEGNTEDKVG